jgi:membrane-bound lytic murein transglycosylase B
MTKAFRGGCCATWDRSPERFTLTTAPGRMRKREDPWNHYSTTRQRLSATATRALDAMCEPGVYNSPVQALLLTLALITLQDPPRPSFSEWLDGVREEALERGIRQEIVDEALGHIDEPMPVVLERDRAQAEAVFSLERYITRQLTAKKLRNGREKFAEQRELLDAVAKRYGVPAQTVAGVWGMETNFGSFSGIRPTVAALATLAWDPRRSAFFRGELFDALEILNRGDIEFDSMKGSWAGAMGQVQFMPSSYLKFAEDFDGDGRKDIWSTPADIFASAANYLKGHGWTEGQTWGREVVVPAGAAKKIASEVARREGGCRATRDMTVPLPLAQWRKMGVRLTGGRPLPNSEIAASLVSGDKRRFLVYGNYDALLQYNCAHSYAISVALLGDAIATAPKAASKASKADQ